MAVSQRLLPLRCVICRAKILRLKQTLIPRDVSDRLTARLPPPLPLAVSLSRLDEHAPLRVLFALDISIVRRSFRSADSLARGIPERAFPRRADFVHAVTLSC